MLTIKAKLAPTWFPVEEAEFLLAPLSKYDAIDFRNEIAYRKGKITVSGEGVRIAGNAVRDWRNVFDGAGQPITFSREQFDELSTTVLTLIAVEVFNRTFLSEIERKN